MREYAGLWVGLKKNTNVVVASGKTVVEVINKSNKKGVKDPMLFKVPSEITPYVGRV